MGDQVAGRRDDLAQVVRGHVGGHAHGDAGGAVDQEVGEGRGQDLRFGLLPVVVRFEVDDVLVDGGDQQVRGGVQACLGVTHGRGGVVAAQRTEVAVAVDQGHTHGEGLAHPHQGVVDGGVAVGVEAPHHLSDDAGALDVSAVGPEAHLVHLVEDAPLYRFHTVARIRQGALVDHRVRVLQEAAAHLLGDVDVDDLFGEILGGTGSSTGHVRNSGLFRGLKRTGAGGWACVSRATEGFSPVRDGVFRPRRGPGTENLEPGAGSA